MRFAAFLRLVSILVFGAVWATAQVGTATITGSVVDPTGAVITGVDVTVVNTDTNFRFAAKTCFISIPRFGKPGGAAPG